MHDNRNHLGANWTGQSPRTFRDAFPHGASLYTGRPPRRFNFGRWVRLAAAVLAAFVAGYVFALLGLGR